MLRLPTIAQGVLALIVLSLGYRAPELTAHNREGCLKSGKAVKCKSENHKDSRDRERTKNRDKGRHHTENKTPGNEKSMRNNHWDLQGLWHVENEITENTTKSCKTSCSLPSCSAAELCTPECSLSLSSDAAKLHAWRLLENLKYCYIYQLVRNCQAQQPGQATACCG